MRLAASMAVLLVPSVPAWALLAGEFPDSPAWRVDANSVGSPWAGVGSLTVGSGIYSAVALSRWHVLTAAHVVAGRQPESVYFVVNAGDAPSYRIPGEAVLPHPEFKGFDSGRINPADLALVRLALPLPARIPTYPLLRQPIRAGTVLTLVGYGASGSGAGGATVSAHPSVKRTGRNAADRFAVEAGRPIAYVFDFDSPHGGNGPLGGPSLGNRVETTVAGGDSGSPAFASVRGRTVLVGINTFQLRFPSRNGVPSPEVPLFGSGGGGMLVSAYAEWITRTIAGTAIDPQPAGITDPPAETDAHAE